MKTAVIGTGVICEQHMLGLRAVPDHRLVGVCDLSPTMARFAAERFGADAPYTDYREMLDRARPEIVHVLTPPRSHRTIVGDCLDAGAHVIVEKPAALSAGELDDLTRQADRSGRRLVEDHNYRFNEPVLAIERLIGEGRLGEVGEVEVRMALNIHDGRYGDRNLPHPSHRLPAGVLHEFVTHLAYLTLRFLPGEPERVAAAWSNHGGDSLFRYDDLDALLVAGSAHARIRFSARTAPDAFSLTVRGSRGYAETDLFQPHLKVVIPRAGGGKLSPVANQVVNGLSLARDGVRNLRRKVMQQTPYEGLQRFVRRTHAALRREEEPPVTADDMRRTSRLVDTLLAETNRL